MGRGLSDLQKCMLTVAYRNHVAERTPEAMAARERERDSAAMAAAMCGVRLSGSNSPATDCYLSEIKAIHYGWVNPVEFGRASGHKGYTWPQWLRKYPGSQHFDRRRIGGKRYSAVTTAITRAMQRLEERGLIVAYVGKFSKWSGFNLTDAGLKVAKSLTVDTTQQIPPCQPIAGAAA